MFRESRRVWHRATDAAPLRARARRMDCGDDHTHRIRLQDHELAALDLEVADGRGALRSEAVRHGIARLKRDQCYRGEEAVLIDLARRGEPIYPDLDGVLDLPHPALD